MASTNPPTDRSGSIDVNIDKNIMQNNPETQITIGLLSLNTCIILARASTEVENPKENRTIRMNVISLRADIHGRPGTSAV